MPFIVIKVLSEDALDQPYSNGISVASLATTFIERLKLRNMICQLADVFHTMSIEPNSTIQLLFLEGFAINGA
jgi:hypothetical protein